MNDAQRMPHESRRHRRGHRETELCAWAFRHPENDHAWNGEGPVSTILVVDDNQLKRASLAMVLETEGHTVLHATDGVEGLARAREATPDLIIADMIMPRMDGYEFCKGLRADPDLAGIPVVVHSIMDDAKVRLLTRECDVQFFIPIAAKRTDIMSIVNAALEDKPRSLTENLEAITGRVDDVIAELKKLSAKLPKGPR